MRGSWRARLRGCSGVYSARLCCVALAAGCGDGDKASGTQATTAGETTTSPTTAADDDRADDDPARGDEPRLPGLVHARRTAPAHLGRGRADLGVLTQAMLLLLAGPSSGDDETAIPAGTELDQRRPRRRNRPTIKLSSKEFAARGPARDRPGRLHGDAVPDRPRREARRRGAHDALPRRSAQGLRRPAAADRRRDADRPRAGRIDLLGGRLGECLRGQRDHPRAGRERRRGLQRLHHRDVRDRLPRDVQEADRRSTRRIESGTLVVQDDDADGDGKPSYEVRIPLEFS